MPFLLVPMQFTFQSFFSEHVLHRVIGACVEVAVRADNNTNGQEILSSEATLRELASLLRCYTQTLERRYSV